jgi:hypothetical protein
MFFSPLEVGDEEGHVMLIYKAEQIYMLPSGGKAEHGIHIPWGRDIRPFWK